MLAAPSIALDLPMKILVWEDSQGRVWLSYNSPEYLKERHGLPQNLVQNIRRHALATTLQSSTRPDGSQANIPRRYVEQRSHPAAHGDVPRFDLLCARARTDADDRVFARIGRSCKFELQCSPRHSGQNNAGWGGVISKEVGPSVEFYLRPIRILRDITFFDLDETKPGPSRS